MTMMTRIGGTKRVSTIPTWVKLGAAGFGALGLAYWAPDKIDVALVLGGFMLLLGAIIGLRFWVNELVPRVARRPVRDASRGTVLYQRHPSGMLTEFDESGETAGVRVA